MLGGIGGFAGLFALKLGRYTEPRAGRVHRRGGHQGRDRPGAGQARHDRARPGGDGGRRPRGVRGRAAVPAGLHRGRQARARARSRPSWAGIAEGCQQAGCALLGGETAEHPGHDGGGRVRPVGHRRRRSSRPTRCCGPTHVRPGDVLLGMGSSGPALQRLLAGPPRAAADRPDAAGGPRRGARPHPRRGAARPHHDLRARLPRAGRRDRACARSRTSPAVGWPATWRGCCPTGWRRRRARQLDARSRCSG